MRDPFASIVEALANNTDGSADAVVRFDRQRLQRTGVPEVVFGVGKSDEQLVAACAAQLEYAPRVIVSRIDVERAKTVVACLGTSLSVEQPFPGSTFVFVRDNTPAPTQPGFVAVLTAGTSDLASAGEAATLVQETGCRVEIIADVGVAGLQRLVQPLRRIIAEDVDAIIVAAGMDGALPSVVSGLVDVPVIGLPTSVGYGVAAGGQTALMTMLATCAPGLAVVNIDNGIGAGAIAARIARRASQPRS